MARDSASYCSRGVTPRCTSAIVRTEPQRRHAANVNTWEGSTTAVYTVVWRNFRGLRRRGKYGAVIGYKGTHSLVIHTGHKQKHAFSDQSQRHISPFSSNHGISPDDSVNYSG
jgi:hypothetical protein